MTNHHWQTTMAAMMCLSLLMGYRAQAADVIPLTADNGTLFADYDPKAKADRNVSGATCFSDGSCILVSDEMIAVQRIQLKLKGKSSSYSVGRTYGRIFGDKCTDIGKKKKCNEVDLEAIASNGNKILVTGSMGNKSKSGKRARDRWFLGEFAIGKNGKPRSGSLSLQSKRSVLKVMFEQHGALKPYVEKPLQCGGINIEGLAVLDDQIFFGLRSPSGPKNGQAYILQADDRILSTDNKKNVGSTTLHRLTFKDRSKRKLKNLGIRALETIGTKMLIVTADSGVSSPDTPARRRDITSRCVSVPNGADLPNVATRLLKPKIWLWDPNTKKQPVEIFELGGDYGDEKLEGIAIIPGSASRADTVDLLLTIDGQNDVPALALLQGLEIPNL